MIAAAMMGRMLNKIAPIVVMKIVKRCHVEREIERGGGVNHIPSAKSNNNSGG
jgi:hypothetical protein